jgi:carboxypeptidase Q
MYATPSVPGRLSLLLIALAAPFLPAVCPAQTSGLPDDVKATASALHKEALAGTRAFDIVRSLTVEVGARFAGSKAHDDAVAWGLRTLKELGFSNVRAEKTTVPRWVRGAESGEILAPYPQPVFLAALGGSVGTPEPGIEAQVIEVPSLDAVDKLDPAQVQGKIVFYNVKMQRAKDGSGYGRAVGVRGVGASRAAKLGAVAVLIRSIGTDNNRTPHTGAMRYQDGVSLQPGRRSPGSAGRFRQAGHLPPQARGEDAARRRDGERRWRDPRPREAGGDRAAGRSPRLLGCGDRCPR